MMEFVVLDSRTAEAEAEAGARVEVEAEAEAGVAVEVDGPDVNVKVELEVGAQVGVGAPVEVKVETETEIGIGVGGVIEDDEDFRRRTRGRFPLALPAPPIPGETESGLYITRDGSEESAGNEYRQRHSSPPRSSESDTEDEIPPGGYRRQSQKDRPQPGAPPFRGPEVVAHNYRGSLSTEKYIEREEIHGKGPAKYRPENREGTQSGENGDVRGAENLARPRRRVTFAPSLPGGSAPPLGPAVVIRQRKRDPLHDHRNPTGSRASNSRRREASKDQDSIFFYLPSERAEEKAKEEALEQSQPTPELPKVLPVFQWPTKASAENKIIEKQFLSRKRSASRGSRNSNTPKKSPAKEVEASDESYTVLKLILDELHRRIETCESRYVIDAYSECGSSDYMEVENSLKEIENTANLSADSRDKDQTLELIAERKQILELCRKIFSFFIPQNWKKGRFIECFWFSVLQLVICGVAGPPRFSCSEIVSKLESIDRHIQVILAGVAGDNVENPRYRIPSALFEAFLKFAEAIILSAVELGLLCENSLVRNQDKDRQVAIIQRLVVQRLSACRSRLREGKFQLMCIVLTGRTKDQMNYEEACTETIVSFILRNSICVPITDVEGASTPTSIYREKLMNMDVEAKYRPQQRILQDILYLGAEVSAFDKVRMAQSRALWGADTLLHPKGSLDIREPRSQESLVGASARSKMGGGVEHFFAQEEECVKDTFIKAKALHESVQEALSVKDEDNGKAILVFTIVTTIFLPLNFVTSFFGMNTTDIRDIDRDQRIFWTTAIPVTVVVLGLSISWAYFGDSIQDRLFGPYSTLGKLFKGRLNNRRTGAVVDEDKHPDEKYDPAPRYQYESHGPSIIPYENYEHSKHERRQPPLPPYSDHHIHRSDHAGHPHHEGQPQYAHRDDHEDPPDYGDRDRGDRGSRGSQGGYPSDPYMRSRPRASPRPPPVPTSVPAPPMPVPRPRRPRDLNAPYGSGYESGRSREGQEERQRRVPRGSEGVYY
ncbi:hypothetical protein TWF718_000245 [Orbilia javanica]|uniref:Uncharacterized protein n=1 Tax=Orbilia javanica TaxID=47235 RepID=A0AAN8MZ17_9PEZI